MTAKLNQVLYVGGGHSNHAGEDKRGEIIVATFSRDPADSIRERYPNRFDYSAADEWLKKEGNDYRFTVLTDKDAASRNNNLSLIVPLLAQSYLENNPLPIKNIDFLFGGPVTPPQRTLVESDFPQYLASLEGYTKKIHVPDKKKRIRHLLSPLPRSIVVADTIANWLYESMNLHSLLSHPKYLGISQKLVLSREERLAPDQSQKAQSRSLLVPSPSHTFISSYRR